MLIVGAIAFVEDGISTYLLYKEAKGSLNIRSAFIHMLADTLATIGVIVSSLLIMFYDFYITDPMLTAAISIYIFVHSYHELKNAVRIIMESTPEGFAFDEMVEAIQAVGGVKDIHHVHTWMLDEQRVAMEAHVAVTRQDLVELEAIKGRIKQKLQEEFNIDHATLEFEIEGVTGHDPSPIPDV